jgi:hypothetical protein
MDGIFDFTIRETYEDGRSYISYDRGSWDYALWLCAHSDAKIAVIVEAINIDSGKV